MSWNQLVYWLAGVGVGTWSAFKRAVATLAPDGSDVAIEARKLRTRFSELGFADFFIHGREGWRAFQPMLVASPHRPQEGFLAGARTAALVDRLRAATAATGCQLFELASDGFTNVRVYGPRIAEAATVAQLPFEADIGQRLARQLAPLHSVLLSGRRSPPTAWSVRSFDLGTARWVDGWVPGTVTEHTSSYQERAYYVQAPDGQHFQLPKREAIFTAAWLNNVTLAEYDNTSGELRTRVSAPLPDACARAACLAGGRPSLMRGDRLIYANVPANLAATLLVSLNHPAPHLHACDSPARAKGRQ